MIPLSQFSQESQTNLRVFTHALFREDDNGARFLIGCFYSREAAQEKAAELAKGGHKQYYFVEKISGEAAAQP